MIDTMAKTAFICFCVAFFFCFVGIGGALAENDPIQSIAAVVMAGSSISGLVLAVSVCIAGYTYEKEKKDEEEY